VELALYLKRNDMRPRQVQDFIPTPMAVATTMYYTGIDPLSMQPVYSAKELHEKRMMKALIFYWDTEHWMLAREALKRAGRADLIGRGPHCLIPPEGARDRHAADRARLQRTDTRRNKNSPRPFRRS
jgi:Domain of unknown function (DUF3362)